MNNSLANPQSRRWLLTIVNPRSYGFSHKRITDALRLPDSARVRFCNSISKTGTPHTHVYIFSPTPIRFNTLKNRIPIAYIDKAYGPPPFKKAKSHNR